MRLASVPLSIAPFVFTFLTLIFPVVLSDSFRNGGNFPHAMRHVHPAIGRRSAGSGTGSRPLPSGTGSASGVIYNGSFPTGFGTASGASATASMVFPGTNASSLASTLRYSRTSKCVTTRTVYKSAAPTGSATSGQSAGGSTPTGQPGGQGSSGDEPSEAGTKDQESSGHTSQGAPVVVENGQPQDKHIQPSATSTINIGPTSGAQSVSNSNSNSGSGSDSGTEPNHPDADDNSPSGAGGGAGGTCPPQATHTVTAQSTVTVTVTATPSPDPTTDSGGHGAGAGAGASTRTKYSSSGFVPSGASTGVFPSGTGGYLGGGVQNGTYVRHRV